MDDVQQVMPMAYSYRQTALALGISEGMVKKLVRQGQLHAVRIGRCRRVPKTELLRLTGTEPALGESQ